ncbi:MAG TPA: hypothetical protein VGL47_36135 [Amycolatopsis sp.]|uniref:Secreted protein n=1 Tax=Amycolatopsis nalaikhensis TaxID=715472 RepID=A0ABY8XRE4_9PSEU|nr:hypothetical protein [Amycolatopsis sp. 2-2]WIV58234.1 hypothetical protein QP939_06120 [Amycolatopsis sp. 2-2]
MTIDWSALGTVFVIALGSVAVLASLFSFGVVGLSQREAAREAGGSGTGQLAGAVVCFAVCAAIIGYGIYLIVA